MAQDTMKIIVDDEAEIDFEALVAKKALSFPKSNIAEKVVSVAVEEVSRNVKNSLATVLESLSDVDIDNDRYDVDQIKFTLAFDAKGEVGLMSAVKGSVGGKTGIEFTLKRKVGKA